MKTVELLFAGLLYLYPRRFRSEYAVDMRRCFADRWAEAARDRRRAFLLVSTLANVCTTAAAERWRSSLDATVAPSPVVPSTGGFMSTLVQDVRYAMRLLRRQPGFSLFVVLTLAIGIGANTAVFSVVNGVLLKPLPFPDSERLVSVIGRFDPESGFNFPEFPLSGPEYVDYRSESRAMEDVAAYRRFSVTVGGPGAEPERVIAALASANLFSVLQVTPVAGRPFGAADDAPDAPATAILSYGYWHGRFGGEPSVVGRVVPMNGVPTTIVGVMPEGFTFPGTTTRIWQPLQIDPANPGNRKGHDIRAIGRLAQGTTVESATVEMRTLMNGWKARFPDIHTGHYLFLRPLLDDVAGSVRPALMLLLGATAFVLLIVCANVSNMVLARGELRVREMAIRGALGANRARLVRLSLVESALLALAGGVLGAAFAWAGVQTLIAIDPESIPRAADVAIDGRMLRFAGAMSVVAAGLFGLVPALRGAAADFQGTLRESGLSASGSSARLWFRRSLVALEVALSVVLVVGAGLMIRSLDRLFAVDPGFQPEGLAMTAISLPAADYREPERVSAFYDRLLDRVRALPGVTNAAVTSGVPLWSDAGVWDFQVEGRPQPAPGEMAWNAGVTIVSPGFFETLRIPLVRGRPFTRADDARAMPVTAINETMAARFFPGEDPVGRRIRVSGNTNPEAWMMIVGIVGDIRDQSLDGAPRPMYYLVHAQMAATMSGPARSLAIVTRAAAQDAVLGAVRGVVHELDPALPVFDVQNLETIIAASVARPRFTTTLLGLFALIGLALGASGIYGVLSYTVSRRTQEIGIRRALGAPASRLMQDVVRQGMLPVAIGLLAGLGASFWTTTLHRSQLFGVSPTDAITYAAVTLAVLVVAFTACLLPARRALRVSPIVALRAE